MDDALKLHKLLTYYTQDLLDAVREGEMPGWQHAVLDGVEHWIQPDGKAFHIDTSRPVTTQEHEGKAHSIVPMVHEWYPKWPAAECHHSDEVNQVSAVVENAAGERWGISKACRYCDETFDLPEPN